MHDVPSVRGKKLNYEAGGFIYIHIFNMNVEFVRGPDISSTQ